MDLPLYIICFFSLTAFTILSLFSLVFILMIICHGEVLFWSNLFGVLEASCIWMGKTFLRFGKFSIIIILLNILHIPLACTYSPSSIPMILRFSLLMESVSSCILLSQLLSYLTKISCVFSLISILSLSSETLSSTCSSLLEWPPTVCFTKNPVLCD
jgi:hypothetical protein